MNESTRNKTQDPALWVEQYGDILYRFALARVRNTSVAEDLVQETFLAALRNQKSFEGKSAERTWFIGILKHKIIDHLRKASREVSVDDETMAAAQDSDMDDAFDESGHWRMDQRSPQEWGDDPRRVMERTQFWEVMRVCLDQLPERLAQVFTMREIDGAESENVCQVLEITPTNLWVMLHRARGRLRSCFETYWLGMQAERDKP